MPGSIPVALQSQNVCWSCRVRKQRCDKSLPSCSRCASKLLRCNYAWAESEPRTQHCQSPSPVTPTSLLVRRCPDCLDLSTYCARELLQAAGTDLDPCHLARLICEFFDTARITIKDIVDDYCATIHPWLPIIDQEQLRTRLGSWPQSGDAELATLIWALYLVTRRPCVNNGHSMRNLSYQTLGQIFMLRATAGATLELLQAGLLITYYACGHGLPRDAYMTLATCVTIARLMGFDFEDTNDPPGLDSQHSVCRWAIVLLDRTVALSSVNDPVPLALPLSPNSNAKCLASVLDSKGPYRSFDISSRVALLIGAALGYANDPRPIRLAGSTYGDTYNRMEILVRELIFTNKNGPDPYTFCESTALAVIAHLALQIVNPSGKNIGANPKEELLLRSTLRMVRDQFRASTHMVQEGNADSMPVVALCALSRAAAISVRLCENELLDEELHDLRFNLQRFGSRWTIGRIYLQYIDEITHVKNNIQRT
ncbi:hypothetical protein K469DRAFT_650145 [Zopfia rhizophila CBS 207.26]|uniref:Zn(2)-C6 fungal-type domain-containing protein n=1 Tax=Zopfia rhizophila CBS 207.26 TaxID=1314779 RepID=A0A6A6ET78_9PEZI|nr:hypothetical protein K469DRAFT_650145 [Zopfia rhizophila CBS 207.26]